VVPAECSFPVVERVPGIVQIPRTARERRFGPVAPPAGSGALVQVLNSKLLEVGVEVEAEAEAEAERRLGTFERFAKHGISEHLYSVDFACRGGLSISTLVAGARVILLCDPSPHLTKLPDDEISGLAEYLARHVAVWEYQRFVGQRGQLIPSSGG
jgi:hypothetical protein